MKTQVQPTSLTAYQQQEPTRQTKAEQVYEVIRSHSSHNRINATWAKGITNQEIKFLLGWEICSVTGRTNDLVKAGRVCKLETRVCRVKGSKAIAWRARR